MKAEKKTTEKNTKYLKLIAFFAVLIFVFVLFSGINVSKTSNKDIGSRSPAPSSVGTSSTTTNDPMHNGTVSISSPALNNLTNKQAPAFSFADRDGNVYSSENLRGKRIVLFFTEGLMCYPACWNQIIAFTKDARFKNSDALVLSVVVDSKEDWQKAINRVPELAQATVVFDTNSAASKQFGMLSAPSSMHSGSLPGHTYVIIDKQGVVRSVIDDPNMSVNNDKVFTEIQKLN